MSSYNLLRIVPAFVNDNINYPIQFRNTNVLATPIVVLDAPCTLYGYNLINTNASVAYLKIYDKASAPTVGVDIPVHTIRVPNNGSVVIFGSDQYIYFSLGMWIACVTGVQDLNTTPPAVGIMAQIQYK